MQNDLKNENLYLYYRDIHYAERRNFMDKPLAFISHDSHDKVLIAQKIASGLTQRKCPVWYDEYSLNVGDNLRESIEKGLKECKKCVLILSSSFLNNKGWTKTEFDSIFTRERLEKKDIILPVWYGVTETEIFDYSPTLANRIGLTWSDDLHSNDILIDKLQKAILLLR